MTRLVAAIILAFTVTTPIHAEESPSSTIEAAQRLAELFSDMLKPFQEIGAEAEQSYFIDQLLKLNRDLFEVEMEKRFVIVALNRKPIDSTELARTEQSLSRKLNILKIRLIELAPKLRVTYREGADEAIDLLSDAIATRKGFVYDLSRDAIAGPSRAIEDATKAIEALSAAQTALANAISHLQNAN